jgi:DNA-directed RNA polymerase I, II, and III subunit RPABC2
MSYFDENYNGGDGSDDDEKNSSSGSDDSDTETNVDEAEVDIEVDEDEVVEGKESENESEEDDIEVEGKKTDYKKQFGVDFGSDDDEDVVDYAKRRNVELKENEVDSENDSEPEQPVAKKKTKKLPATKLKAAATMLADEEDDDEDPTGEVYLQKFDKEINDNYLVNFHPESAVHNYDEILVMTKVVRDRSGIIVDDLHKTIPYLTKYEKARVLGQRAKQINSGASVFVKVPEKVIDGYLIAELELQEKRIPFIIRRPLPNGGSEYWSIKDLENISF